MALRFSGEAPRTHRGDIPRATNASQDAVRPMSGTLSNGEVDTEFILYGQSQAVPCVYTIYPTVCYREEFSEPANAEEEVSDGEVCLISLRGGGHLPQRPGWAPIHTCASGIPRSQLSGSPQRVSIHPEHTKGSHEYFEATGASKIKSTLAANDRLQS